MKVVEMEVKRMECKHVECSRMYTECMVMCLGKNQTHSGQKAYLFRERRRERRRKRKRKMRSERRWERSDGMILEQYPLSGVDRGAVCGRYVPCTSIDNTRVGPTV